MPLPTFGLGSLWGFLTGAAKHEFVRNGVIKAYDVLGSRAKTLIETNQREAYTEVIRHLEVAEPAAADRIKKAQQQALDAGVENPFILTLGSYIPLDEAGKVKMDEALKRFAWLGGKDDPGFNLTVEGLKHDPVARFVRHWILGNLAAAWSFIDGAADELARHLKPTVDRLRAEAEEKGVRSWLRFS